MQLPPELADVTDTQRTYMNSCDADLARSEPAELLIAQIRVGQSVEELAGARSAQHQYAVSFRHIPGKDRSAGHSLRARLERKSFLHRKAPGTKFDRCQ